MDCIRHLKFKILQNLVVFKFQIRSYSALILQRKKPASTFNPYDHVIVQIKKMLYDITTINVVFDFTNTSLTPCRCEVLVGFISTTIISS